MMQKRLRLRKPSNLNPLSPDLHERVCHHGSLRCSSAWAALRWFMVSPFVHNREIKSRLDTSRICIRSFLPAACGCVGQGQDWRWSDIAARASWVHSLLTQDSSVQRDKDKATAQNKPKNALPKREELKQKALTDADERTETTVVPSVVVRQGQNAQARMHKPRAD